MTQKRPSTKCECPGKQKISQRKITKGTWVTFNMMPPYFIVILMFSGSRSLVGEVHKILITSDQRNIFHMFTKSYVKLHNTPQHSQYPLLRKVQLCEQSGFLVVVKLSELLFSSASPFLMSYLFYIFFLCHSVLEAFVTLATSDAYCMGSLVVGKSLRRHGTTRKLVAMVSPNISREAW